VSEFAANHCSINAMLGMVSLPRAVQGFLNDSMAAAYEDHW
jgi:hypothetical protein